DDCFGDGVVDCDECVGGELTCSACDGAGNLECSDCGGKGCSECVGGEKECAECKGAGDVECDDCDGEGKQACATCHGAGEALDGDRWGGLLVVDLNGRVIAERE